MDNDEFEAWKLCWQLNLFFYKPVTKAQICILCSEITPLIPDEAGLITTRRSNFWLEATWCSEGHRQAGRKELEGTNEPTVCAKCDQNFMLDVVRGKHVCRIDGCRRVVRVGLAKVEDRLKVDKALVENFISMLEKFRVYECAIHGDDVTYESNCSSIFKPPTDECAHDRKVCDPCLKDTYERAIQGGRLRDLVCSDPECKKSISLSSIRQLVSTEVFKIYSKKLALETLSRDERFRWCTCGHGQLHGPGENSPEWHCLSCKKRHCYICHEEPTDTCLHLRHVDAQKAAKKTQQRESAQQLFSTKAERAAREREEAERNVRKEEAAASQREIARTTKKCPKQGCNNKIERNNRCGQFTCHKCKTDFCWACKVIWKGGKALHLSGCKIGTTSTISKSNLDIAGYATGWDVDRGYDLSLDKGLWLIDSQQ